MPMQRWSVHGRDGHPVRAGDPHLCVVIDGSPHTLSPLDAVRLGEALTVAGSRAASAAPSHGHGHKDEHDTVIDDVRMED